MPVWNRKGRGYCKPYTAQLSAQIGIIGDENSDKTPVKFVEFPT